MHDSMTGLSNRDLFDDRLSNAISLAQRHDWMLAVMFLDLNGFKTINDTHGHAVGDSVLKEVARRLSERSRDEDTVCRNGGDEFLYLLVDPRDKESIGRIADLVSVNIAKPIAVGGRQFVVNASIGVAVYPVYGTTGDELIKSADTAMYRAKKHGSGCMFFEPVEKESVPALITSSIAALLRPDDGGPASPAADAGSACGLSA
jgi:diguanylate cyclase (GGDEF)-like protein